MNKNLSLYFSKEDYENLSGDNWPSYENFLTGDRGTDPKVSAHIETWIQTLKTEGIRFPIRTKTSCQSKWTWSTLYLNQLSSASCHRVKPVPFSIDEFDNFHNLPTKLNDRKLMLEGKWPQGGCEYCQTIEDSGGWSDRQHNLEIRDLTPPELENNPLAIEVTPRIVEIFAQNTCNLSCTYCNGNLSSKIAQENKKFGDFNQNGVRIPINTVPDTTKEYFSKFLTWLENNISQLKRLHLLGGETFLQHDLIENVLKIIEKKPNPKLEICIFSNMNAPDRYWDLYISQLRDLQHRGHYRYFDLTASIDCWGKEAEYARTGLDLSKLEERLAWAAEQDDDWLRINVNQTVTSLTMRTMPELIDKIAKYSKHKHIGHYFQFYTGPHMFQHPKIYNYNFWEKDFIQIYKAMPTNTSDQLEAIQRMQGMEKLLQSITKHNYQEIKKLHVYLDELDRRRNTDWRSIFSYLDISE
jgi:sulfatase maturation enzyme AslB (radical SAM superfamily)